MKGKSLIAENRELAFRIYCAQGGNVEATIRELAKQGLSLSKPSFNEWREKFNFDERLRKIDEARTKANDEKVPFVDGLLNSLTAQKEKYDAYFETLSTPDHQAQYAYAGIIKTLFDIKLKAKKLETAADDVTKIAKKSGLSDDAAAQIREKILGIGK